MTPRETLTAALPAWFEPAVRRSVALCLDPVSRVPLRLRKVPLWCLARYAEFVAWRVL